MAAAVPVPAHDPLYGLRPEDRRTVIAGWRVGVPIAILPRCVGGERVKLLLQSHQGADVPDFEHLRAQKPK